MLFLNRVNHAKLANITKPVFGEDMIQLEERILSNNFTNSALIIQLKNKEPIDVKNSRIVYDDESVARKKCEKNETNKTIYYLRINNKTEYNNKSDYKIFNGIIGSYNKTNDIDDAKTFVLMYAQNGINNDFYINITLNNINIEHNNKTLSQTLNACFGVIYSGGKNDKDVCRNVFKETCGNELDYRCKESGLYDILTENPPSENYLPEPCRSGNETNEKNISVINKCQYWFYTYMTNGNIELKPSAIVGFSLLVQANYSNKKDCIDNSTCDITEEFNISKYINDISKLYNINNQIFNWYIPTAVDLEDEAERAAYFLIENSGYIKVYILLFFLLYFIIF